MYRAFVITLSDSEGIVTVVMIWRKPRAYNLLRLFVTDGFAATENSDYI